MMNKFVGCKRVLTLLTVAVVLAVLGTGIGLKLNVSPNQPDSAITVGQQQVVITIGTKAYAAGVADYTADGVDDNVQFQAALNALPSNGGKLVVLAGNYVFSATVSRLLDNVTIQGVGQATYFANNGVTAIFSAGSQSNWIFRDFRTDAGGLTITLASRWIMENITLGATYYAYRASSDITGAMVNLPTGRTATLVVAASNAPAASKAQADYVCDGTADNVEIQAAINALPVTGGLVELSGGTFNIAGSLIVTNTNFTGGSGIWLKGSGRNTTYLKQVASVDILQLTGTAIDFVDYPKISDLYFLQAIYGIFSGHAIKATAVGELVVEDCGFGRINGAAIYLDGVRVARINNGYFDSSGQAATYGVIHILSVTASTTDIVINNPTFAGGYYRFVYASGAAVQDLTINRPWAEIVLNSVDIGMFIQTDTNVNGTILNEPIFYNSPVNNYFIYLGGTFNHVIHPHLYGGGATGGMGLRVGAYSVVDSPYITDCKVAAMIVAAGTRIIMPEIQNSGVNGGTRAIAATQDNIEILGGRIVNAEGFIDFSGGVRSRAIGVELIEGATAPSYGFNLGGGGDYYTITNNTIVGANLQVVAVKYQTGTHNIVNNNSGYISPSEIRTTSGSLTAGVANAIAFAWHNSETQDIIIKKVVIEITTGSVTANSVIDVGIADNATGTNRGVEFFDDLDANDVDVNDSWVGGDGGTQTKWVFCQDSASATDGWVVGQILVADAAALVGKYYIEYVGR